MIVLSESELRATVAMTDAIPTIEAAFGRLARGEVELPDAMNFDIREGPGEIHVRGAHLAGARHVVIKVATGFWENRSRGLPTGNGLMLAIDAATGVPAALLLDNGFLTELRTGAAGAVAAKYLARKRVGTVALIGAGEQAPFQLAGLLAVRSVERAVVWSRRQAHAESFAREVGAELGIEIGVADSVEAAVQGADVIVTATPSHEPLVRAEWLAPGAHLTAVGSDGPTKQELDVSVLARADLIVADRLAQCLMLGEIHHAVEAGVLDPTRIHGELGDLVVGRIPGRSNDRQITVCDLTGIGVQDAAIATLALERARAQGLGRPLASPES